MTTIGTSSTTSTTVSPPWTQLGHRMHPSHHLANLGRQLPCWRTPCRRCPASEAILSVPSDVPQDGPEQRAWSAKLHHFHKAAGHPTNLNLVHLLRDARLPEWKIQMARDFKCASCEALRPGGSSSGSIPPASTHPLYRAWQAIGVDVTEWVIPNSKLKLKFMLIMDLATRLRAVRVIKCYDVLKMQSESSADIIKGLARSRHP